MSVDLDLPPLDTVTVESGENDEQQPKRTRKPRSDRGQARGPRGAAVGRSTAKLRDDLTAGIATLALVCPLPTVSAVLVSEGEATAAALCRVAAKHPKMLAALKAASSGTDYLILAKVAAMIVLAALMDTGRIEPGALLGMAPVDRMAETVANLHQDVREQPTQSADGSPPGVYVPTFPR